MKHGKALVVNIAPENRLTFEEKLEAKGIKYQKITLHKYKGRMGIFCPWAMDVFVEKNLCKSCKRWVGGTGKFYYCENKL